MKKVAFICVHNSCRSQIAQALGNHFARDVFESYSAGTETKPHINADAIRLMKEIYGIDMEDNGQYSKTLKDIPQMDLYISMGCNVSCPFIGKDVFGIYLPSKVYPGLSTIRGRGTSQGSGRRRVLWRCR